MKSKQAYCKQTYIFLKWTRKAYAVFNSLKKQITISELRFEMRSVKTEIKQALALILEINFKNNKQLTERLAVIQFDTKDSDKTNIFYNNPLGWNINHKMSQLFLFSKQCKKKIYS